MDNARNLFFKSTKLVEGTFGNVPCRFQEGRTYLVRITSRERDLEKELEKMLKDGTLKAVEEEIATKTLREQAEADAAKRRRRAGAASVAGGPGISGVAGRVTGSVNVAEGSS